MTQIFPVIQYMELERSRSNRNRLCFNLGRFRAEFFMVILKEDFYSIYGIYLSFFVFVDGKYMMLVIS